MSKEWVNWSGSLRFTPERLVRLTDEASVVQVVREAAEQGRKVRVVGAGHSSVPLVETSDVLVSLRQQKRVLSVDREANRATLECGFTVAEAGDALLDHGLSMHNTGDVDVQLVAGAISTGTHGTGACLPNLSWMLHGVRLVNGRGEIVETDRERDPSFMRAATISLGTLGVLTAMTLRLEPAFRLERREYFVPLKTCLALWDELREDNRNFDFYWYPRSDLAKVRLLNLPGRGTRSIAGGTVDKKTDGFAAEVLPRKRDLRFDEMEYQLPAADALACFAEVRERVRAQHRATVAWRVLVRTIAADDAYLSPASGRDTVCISLHHNAGLPYDAYFQDIEPLFRAFGGRPHWGKKHSLKAAELAPLYPGWAEFRAHRQRMDPGGLFVTPYIQELLGD